MVVFIIILMLLTLSFAIKILFKLKEEEAIVISFFGIILITYLFGLLGILGISLYFIYFLMFISFIYIIVSLIEKKVFLKELITLPTIIYIGIIILIYNIFKDYYYAYYDEFMFWGTNLKTMLSESCLWASFKVDGIHLVYPPFTALAEYLFCRINGKFSEGISYFAIISLIFTSLMPLLKNESYNLKSFVKISLTFIGTYLLILFFNYELANLSVDCILGVFFAVLMMLIYKLDNKKDYLVICILLISITLVKTNGILFAGIGIMQLFFIKVFNILKQRKNIKKDMIIKEFSIVGLLLILIISTAFIWKSYYTLNGKKIDDRHDKNTTQTIDFKEFFYASTLNNKASKRNIEVSKNFYDKLRNEQIVKKDNYNATLIILLIINLFYILFLIFNKEKLKSFANLLSINLGFVLYIFTNLLMFMFVFQYDQGNMLMGFYRYMETYMLSMALNLFFCLLNDLSVFNMFFISFILININDGSIFKLNYRPTINDITKANASIILSNVKKEEKVFIIDQKLDYGSEFVTTKYLISPIKTNLLYEWNVGCSDYGIYYKIALSLEEFRKMLKKEKYDYIFLISIDYSFLNDYSKMFTKDAIKRIKMLENNWYSNGILLDLSKDLIK